MYPTFFLSPFFPTFLNTSQLFPYFKLPHLNFPIQTTSSSRASGVQNEDAAKEIADLKKQLEQAKKIQRDFGMFFHPAYSRTHPY
jgi:hypothetical protein